GRQIILETKLNAFHLICAGVESCIDGWTNLCELVEIDGNEVGCVVRHYPRRFPAVAALRRVHGRECQMRCLDALGRDCQFTERAEYLLSDAIRLLLRALRCRSLSDDAEPDCRFIRSGLDFSIAVNDNHRRPRFIPLLCKYRCRDYCEAE